MKRPQEELGGFIQAEANLRNQLLSGCEEHVQRGFANRHSHKLSLKGLPYVLQARLQEFVRWTIVAQNVCEKCLVEGFVDPFIGKQVLNVEQIPRMLSVQCSNQFSRVEVGKRNDLDFSKAELPSTMGRTVLNSTG